MNRSRAVVRLIDRGFGGFVGLVGGLALILAGCGSAGPGGGEEIDGGGTPVSTTGGSAAVGGGPRSSGGAPGATGTPGSGGADASGSGGATLAGPAGSGGAGAAAGGSPAASSSTGGSATGGEPAAGQGSGGSAGSAGTPTTGAGGAGLGGRAGGAAGAPAGGGPPAGAAGAVPLDATLMSKCTGSSPILCTIPVPDNGNYTVTVELGSASAASSSRVQAETYRIVIPEMPLGAGSYAQQTFSVNVRAEDHDGYSAPGKILNVRIDGSAPALHGLGFAAAPNIPTIFVAGDSTVCDWDPIYLAANANTAGPLERGWAQELSQFFDAGIAVANYADSGETASSFYGKFWPPAKALLRPGDYVFVQFGHNDQKNASDVANFTANMMRYVTDALNAKATPVLITPPGRKGASTANPGFDGLDQKTRDLAMSQNVALVDLTNLSLAYYKTLPDKSVAFGNPTEGTHFSETGATALSNLVTTSLEAGTLPLHSLVR
jgi:lysophospholipase L1-like esterase